MQMSSISSSLRRGNSGKRPRPPRHYHGWHGYAVNVEILPACATHDTNEQPPSTRRPDGGIGLRFLELRGSEMMRYTAGSASSNQARVNMIGYRPECGYIFSSLDFDADQTILGA
ncbi:hypothetical protein Hypma_014451, partial [Hypsizygus marmoreus]